jgi:uncharacterized membrane protein YkoI
MIRLILITAPAILAQSPAFAVSVALAGTAEFDAPRLVASQDSPEREPGPADLEEAIEIALKRYGGQAAGAETVVREGQRVHEVRVFGEDGTVRTVRIDPDTGAIIPQQR